MVYYTQDMELEVVSEAFRGIANDVLICRDRLTASGVLYTCWLSTARIVPARC